MDSRPPAAAGGDGGGGGCSCSHHEHAHHRSAAGGHGHGHAPTAGPPSPVERLFDALATSTGLRTVSDYLDHNPRALAAAAGALACAALATTTPAQAAAAALSPSAGPPALAALATLASAASFLAAGLPDVVALIRTALAGTPRALGGAGVGRAVARLDTHSLMAAAALAAACSGSPLEGALLMVLFGGAHALEAALTRVAAGDLRTLLAAAPESAVLVVMGRDGAPDLATAATVPASSVAIGDTTLIRPGQAAAVDGVVVWGASLVSAEHITGEASPRAARPGASLPAGALSHDGALVLRATAPAAASAPARIAALAAAAQASKPRLTAWLDGFGSRYARWVLGATAASFLVLLAAGVPLTAPPGAVGPAGRGAAVRAMALLTAASPCALAVAPLAYVSAIAAASRRGALLKGGAVLDALLRVRTVALDKTGTLTTGRLSCVGAVEVGGGGPRAASHPLLLAPPPPTALALAAALALRSTHPVSAALASAAAKVGVAAAPSSAISAFESVPGCGVRARLERGGGGGAPSAHATVLLGSPEWVAASLPAPSAAALLATGSALESQALTVSALAVLDDRGGGGGGGGGEGAGASPTPPPSLLAAFAFSDGVRSRSAAAVRALKAGGRPTGGTPPLTLLVLTGDNAASAGRVARELGLDPARDVRAGLSPGGKVDAIAAARAAGTGGVLMVGDGVNDAPALAAADVGAAIAGAPGEGATAAAADLLLLGGAGVATLPALLRLAAGTRAVLVQNLVIAGAGVCALAPAAVAGVLPLWAAVLLHEGGTVLVALNSLRPLWMMRGGEGEGEEGEGEAVGVGGGAAAAAGGGGVGAQAAQPAAAAAAA